MIDFAAIKSRHPLEDYVHHRAERVRRAPGGIICACPIHKEANGTSFSVNIKKQVWHCFGKCRAGGDILSLVMALDGAADARAAAEILEGRPLTDDETQSAAARTIAPRAEIVTPKELPELPKFYLGEQRHFDQIATLRKLPHAHGVAMMQEFGVLRFCMAYDQPAYAILDVDNPCNVQVRRMDGELWFGRSKVMGIRRNWSQWPVGLTVLERHRTRIPIMLVEGTGDFIAAWHYASEHGDFVPVAMFGASQPIHPSALPLFHGHKVKIMQQNDPAGFKASADWKDQLQTVAAHPEIIQIPGEGTDLNDHLSAGGELLESETFNVPALPTASTNL
jgi:hypothetical protein